jgi:hypothetical protein
MSAGYALELDLHEPYAMFNLAPLPAASGAGLVPGYYA